VSTIINANAGCRNWDFNLFYNGQSKMGAGPVKPLQTMCLRPWWPLRAPCSPHLPRSARAGIQRQRLIAAIVLCENSAAYAPATMTNP